VIELDRVGKTYRPPFGRTVRAVVDFSLRVPPGEVLGIAGPNGAGKSTLINLLLGYLHPTTGTVRIHDAPPRAFVEREGIGYVSELVAINPRWRADEALERFAVLAGVPGAEVPSRVSAVIARLGLDEHRAKRFRALSKGNQQRLAIAQALLREHRVLIFDEPTHGLDPVWLQRFRDLVAELRRPDRAIVIASHNLDELERVADRVAIIDHGVLQRVVDTRAVGAGRSASTWRITLAAGDELVGAIFPGARALGGGAFEVADTDLATLNDGLTRLLGAGALLSAVSPAYSGLEAHFRAAVGEPA
jgi:ABC-type multidrug transport system ATPase subunit